MRFAALLVLLPALFALILPAAAQEPVKTPHVSVEAVPTPSGPPPLEFEQVEIALVGRSPKVCARFKTPLADGIDWQRYATLSPAADVSLEASTRFLCIDGLDYGARYELTLRAGLPGRDGLRLAETVTRDFDVPDRAPAMRFTAAGTIIPSAGRRALPVETVNLDEVALTVYRLNDRNLIDRLTGPSQGRSVDSYDGRQLRNFDGEEVWTGHLEIAREPNIGVETAVPLDEILDGQKPGYYAIVAEAEVRDGPGRTRTLSTGQWFVLSDIGLTSWLADNGLFILARSLQTGQPIEGVQLELVARNNEILTTAETGPDGLATIGRGWAAGLGGTEPRAIFARRALGDDAGIDFTVVDLQSQVIDLSDHGVGGRLQPGYLDAYLYTDRGIYRSGETIHLTGLLRTITAEAETGVPLTLKVSRPDGRIMQQTVLADEGIGGYSHAYTLSDSAMDGSWRFTVHTSEDAPAIGQVAVRVEDFVPPRLEVTAEVAPAIITPGQTATLTAKADYYYGAPGADLRVEALLDLASEVAPFEEWKEFRFGLANETTAPGSLPPLTGRTNADGQFEVQVPVTLTQQWSRPLRLEATVSVFDIDGRPTATRVSVPLVHQPWMIGVRPDFQGAAEVEQPAPLSLITVNADGSPRAGQAIDWALYRIEGDWIWTERDGRGTWQRLETRIEVTNGSLVSGDEPLQIGPRVEWGTYELVARDPAGATASSVRFYAGWGGSGTLADTPDKIQVDLLERTETGARVRLTPPFAGEATVMLADKTIHNIQQVSLPADGLELTVPLDGAERPGAYVLVTTHMDQSRPQSVRVPRRAMGAVWVPLEVERSTLDVTLTSPDTVRPRGERTVTLALAGASPGAPVRVTLAAVDEGVLRLTRFNRPRPELYYFEQRRLGLRIHDLYGRLVDAGLAADGVIRSGGDEGLADQLGGLTVRSSRVVALYSDILAATAGPDGTAQIEIPLDVPDFNGRLRVMAVVWTEQELGSARFDLTVRDQVVADLTLPRFLAPGDRAEVTVNLRNVDLPNGTQVSAVLQAAGAVQAELQPISPTAILDQGESASFPATLTAESIGTAQFTLVVIPQGQEPIIRSYDLAVRAANPFVTERVIAPFPAGASMEFAPEMLASYSPGTARTTIEISSLPGLDLTTVLENLSLYPYGCTEQTISVAMPLLSYAELVRDESRELDSLTIDNRLRAAVARVSDRQGYNGLFGLWSPDEAREVWLSAYSVDFLTRARERGFEVPQPVMDRGLSALEDGVMRRISNTNPYVGDTYAALILARHGRLRLSDIRYIADTATNVPSPLAHAYLAAALAAGGDRDRARELMMQSVQRYSGARTEQDLRLISRSDNDAPLRWDYGSLLRDQALTLALALQTELMTPVEVARLALTVQENLSRQRWLSTQEQVAVIQAAQQLARHQQPVEIAIDGRPRASDGTWRGRFTVESPETRITNEGGDLFQTISVRGVPREPLPPVAENMAIVRTLYTAEGRLAERDQIRQGDLLVVVLRGFLADGIETDPLVVDLLPAGFEPAGIDVMNSPPPRFAWVRRTAPPSRTRLATARDDRFVAALSTGTRYFTAGERAAFSLAYTVRAVTPGEFVHPGPFVEDMYQPANHARGLTTTLVVQPAAE